MGWIYHEKQESSLCGQHCLNNLLQACIFTAPDLADIAHVLDAKERQLMLELGHSTPDALKFQAEDSGNVDEAGNFSLQVLSEALTLRYGLRLESAGSERVAGKLSTTGYDSEAGFVCNRQAHWFAVRSVGGRYWNLNSTLERPEWITSYALEATLHQYRLDGYSVFVVRGGTLPPPSTEGPYGSDAGNAEDWYGDGMTYQPTPRPRT
ncbi:hypothetical protein JKP88DRAFT_207785 [Tribonema minus]|uniref:ubiquitinyl hydrolase 1 n=1 Tax=Tribonema minus TaxID=303371 RepID=A0A836CJ83_9STRA|nr:hypothetical protein JKP88DRAFT_207785 [Tribonema minus]